MRRVMLLGAVVFASRGLPAQQVDTHSIPAKSRYSLESFAGKRPLTRAERTNFTETSHYDDVVVFIDSLKKLGAKISTGSIAKTSRGARPSVRHRVSPVGCHAGRGAPTQSSGCLHPGEHPCGRGRRERGDAGAAPRPFVRQKEECPRLDRAHRPADLQCRRQREVGSAGAKPRRPEWPGASRHATERTGLESEPRLHRRRRAGDTRVARER